VIYVVIGMYVLCSLTWLLPNTQKPLFVEACDEE